MVSFFVNKSSDYSVEASINTEVNTVIDDSGSLLELIQENLHLPTYHLTEEQQKWIQLFIKCSPESFAKIDSDIQIILSSESLGLQTIPKIIQLCADIFNKTSSEHGIANASNIIELIKFILNILLESSLITLPDIEKAIIQNLVDISLNLLTTILPTSPSPTAVSSEVESPPIVLNNKCCK